MAYYNPHLDNRGNAVYVANCTDSAWYFFERDMKEKLWRVDALLLASAIMAGVIVGIGAYGQRYRHHPFTHFIFLGATNLFLPIISSVVSLSTGFDSSVSPLSLTDFSRSAPALIAVCNPYRHSILVITWALLVQNVFINTSVVVAVDDREGPSVGPPVHLLSQGAWILYLGLSYMQNNAKDTMAEIQWDLQFTDNSVKDVHKYYRRYIMNAIVAGLIEVLPFLITLAKLVFKYYAVRKARQSFAFRHNPRLVSAYMQQLPPVQPLAVGEHAPPPLLVMGEEARHVVKQPHGTVLHNAIIGLVTIDRVWQLLDSQNSNSMLLLAPTPKRLKDLCLSFALFKLLRCRFARYELHTYASSQNTFNFFWSLLLRDGEPAERVFGVIEDELSFLHDHYNSSLPISYSKCWLPIVGIIISLFSITYCIILAVWIMIRILVAWMWLHRVRMRSDNPNFPFSWPFRQIRCEIRCNGGEDATSVCFGNMFLDMVPLSLLLVFVMAAEVRDIVSYICSNWTKVILTCRILQNSEQSLSLHKWFVHVVRCRCKLMKHSWDERMGQCSVLPLRRRTTPLALLRHLLRLPDYKSKIDKAVKVSIIDALQSSRNVNDGGLHLSNGKATLYRSGKEGGERFLWACNRNSASDVILTWQIATSILEVRYPLQLQQQGSSSVTSDGHRTAATHLSRYCTYLVICCPELLPDDDAWTKSLYEAVNLDAERALASQALAGSSSSTLGYQQVVNVLSANSKHPVLKDGVKLGKQLVETISDEEAAWKLLADFWSEMILYVAPSDNLNGHKESIARGGELVTLLWTLLNHAGIVSRENCDAARAAAAGWPSDSSSGPAAGGTSSAGVV